MKTTFVATVLNEEKSIVPLLESIFAQTRLPDEVIIVDGGSKDETVKRIKEFMAQTKVRYYVLPGVNRPRGRNEAIRNSTGEIIVISDAGCVLEKHWVEEIIKPFQNKIVEVVAGFYLPTGDSVLERILGELTSVSLDKVDPKTFLPSSRSIAIRRSTWKKIGGYPDELNDSEDLVFDQNLKNAGVKFAFAPKAIVYWPQEKNIFGALKQYAHYSLGDGIAGKRSPHYRRYLRRLAFWFLIIGSMVTGVFKLGAIVLLGFFGYKSYLLTKKIGNILVFPVALIVLPILNLETLVWFVIGTYRKLRKSFQP